MTITRQANPHTVPATTPHGLSAKELAEHALRIALIRLHSALAIEAQSAADQRCAHLLLQRVERIGEQVRNEATRQYNVLSVA